MGWLELVAGYALLLLAYLLGHELGYRKGRREQRAAASRVVRLRLLSDGREGLGPKDAA